MDIEFRKIDRSNYEECVDLKVLDEQREFVSANWWSLLEANYEDNRYPLAIYVGDTMVGFLMYSFYLASKEYSSDSWWLERFMIDGSLQKKGYGKASLMKFFGLMKAALGSIELRTSAEPDNEVAIKLYESCGFIKTGESVEREEVLLISL